jgi:hypothetical protein
VPFAEAVSVELPFWRESCKEKRIPVTNNFNGAESLLRSWQSLNWQRNSLPCMESEGPLLCSQEPTNVPYLSQMNPITPSHNLSLDILCLWSMCAASLPPHSPWYSHPKNTNEYKLWSFSLCNFICPHVTSSS